MNRTILFALPILTAALLFSAFAVPAAGRSGEGLFKQHCAACHPDGGNVINPNKTLMKKSREANNVKSAADIVKLMRHPGPGMTAFDAKTVPDKDAKVIADYIVKSYK